MEEPKFDTKSSDEEAYNKFLEEETERQAEEYYKDQEEFEKFDAEQQVNKFLNEFGEIKEKTLKNSQNEIIKINYHLKGFYDNSYYYIKEPTKENFYLSMKYDEIITSLFDSFALSIVGRYKTAYFLMRKSLELFAIADYLDSNKIPPSDELANKWAFQNERYSRKTYTDAIKLIDNTANELTSLYDYLCKFAHNAGAKEYQFLFGYDKQAFEIYATKMSKLLSYLSNTIEKKPKPTK